MTLALKKGDAPRHTLPRIKRPTDAEYAKVVRGHASDLQRLNGLLADGKLTTRQWADGFHAILVEGHSDAYALGRQRAGDLTPKGMVDQLQGLEVADGQNERLVKFLADLEAKDPHYVGEDGAFNLDGINARSRMYASRMRGTANEAFLDTGEEEDEYDWLLGPTEHCDDCIELHELGPYTRDTIISRPGDGQTDCNVHCACRLRRKRDGVTGFARPDIFGDRLASSGGAGGGEFPLKPVAPITKEPRLQVLIEGRDHLDIDPETTPEEFRKMVRSFDREVFCLFDPETNRPTHAPIVGLKSSVDYEPFADQMAGKIGIHNHPAGDTFSPQDIEACSKTSLLELQAAAPNRYYFTVRAKKGGWPEPSTFMADLGKAVDACQVAITQKLIAGEIPTATEVRELYDEIMGEALKQLPITVKRKKDRS